MEESNWPGLPIKTNPDLPVGELHIAYTNRWAAFTNDELVALDDCIWTTGQEDGSAGEHLPKVTQDLHIAIRAELERRK